MLLPRCVAAVLLLKLLYASDHCHSCFLGSMVPLAWDIPELSMVSWDTYTCSIPGYKVSLAWDIPGLSLVSRDT